MCTNCLVHNTLATLWHFKLLSIVYHIPYKFDQNRVYSVGTIKEMDLSYLRSSLLHVSHNLSGRMDKVWKGFTSIWPYAVRNTRVYIVDFRVRQDSFDFTKWNMNSFQKHENINFET